MDQNTPREEIQAKSPKTARVALNVLAVCFALSVLGRGLADSFTVFLKPISEDFGWDRAQVIHPKGRHDYVAHESRVQFG